MRFSSFIKFSGIYRLFDGSKNLVEGVGVVVGDEACACFGGMNAVGCPEGGSDADAVGSEEAVERNEGVGEFAGELAGDLDFGIEVNAEEVLVGRGEKELFEDDDLRVGLFLDFGENIAIAFFEIFVRHPVFVAGAMPCVIDTDKD